MKLFSSKFPPYAQLVSAPGHRRGLGWLAALLLVLLAAPAWAQLAFVNSIAPKTGVPGTVVTVTGNNISGASRVDFGSGTTFDILSRTSTGFTVVVPEGSTTAQLRVEVNGSYLFSVDKFTVQQPKSGPMVVDGYRETRYGSAAAVQTTPTGFGNSTSGDFNAAGGSELDAAYTYVHGDSLYVFLAGNLESNGNMLDVFFDTQAGGQNVLASTNPGVDNGGLNAMAGLTFDSSFAPDYYLGVRAPASGQVVQAYFAALGAGGVAADPASTGTTRVVDLALPAGRAGRLAIDESNTGGLDGSSLYFASPAAVVSGLEFALPLAALGNPSGSLKIAAFVNSGNHTFLSNQVLGGLPAGTANLGGPPSAINFGSYAGNQYFSVALPASTTPTITSFTPAMGATGTTVTISGTNLTGATSVSFNGTAGTNVSVNANGSSLTVTVPAGATTGPITVTTTNGSVTTTTSFTALGNVAVISSFAPTSGVAGTAVTLTGNNFTGATGVKFNGTAAAAFVVNSATSLTAVVPAGATTGTISVTTADGTSTSSGSLTVLQPSSRLAIVQDGYRESLYGTALAVQATPTGFGNATNGSQTDAVGGSELDAAYAYVKGDSLHVFLAGNLENNQNALDIFFDSQAGGQNTLTTLGTSMPYNNIAGLTFDPGFTADYVLVTNNVNSVIDAQFANLATGEVSGYATGSSRSVTLPVGAYTAKLAIDESNTGGVDGSSVYGTAPAAVVTGVEFVLPLAALGSPSGSLKVSAFVSNGNQDYLSNQVLGPLPAGTANLTTASAVNFGSYAGNQYFSVALPAAAATITSFTPTSGPVGTTVTINGTNLAGATAVKFNGTAATGYTVNAAGTQITGAVVPSGATTGPISVTTPQGTATSTTAFTVVAGAPAVASFTPASGVAGTVVTLTGTNLAGTTGVKFNGTTTTIFSVTNSTTVVATVPVGATSGPITLTGPNGVATSTSFTVLQPAAGRIVLDGYRETRYGSTAAVQTTPTGFGNSTSGTQASATGGSELDAAYTYVHGDSLYVFLAGNLENNGNTVDIFFDSQTGGQNVLTDTNPNVDNNGLNNLKGLTFDTGFGADYYLTVAGLVSGGVVSTSFASLGTTGVGVSPASTGTGRVVSLTLPNNLAGTLAIDQSNTGGVSDGAVIPGAPASVVTGLEFVLPLAALGSPTGSLKVAAFINNGAHTYLSNQVLGGLPDGTANLAAPGTVNFGGYAGNQYFTVALPTAAAPTITSFSPVSGPVGTVVTITGTGFTGATAVTFNGTAAVTYTVNSATSITVTVPAGATAGLLSVVTPNGTATSATGFCVQYTATTTGGSRCGSGSVTLAASGAPTGGTYAYYAAATGGAALGSGASFTTPSLTASTTYYVGITTGSGTTACEGPRTAVTATINTLPAVSVAASGPTTFCQGGSVTLTASGGGTYLWSTGATTASISVSAAGSYTVTATNAAGCTATSSAVAVVVNPLPSISSAAGGPTTFCQGGSVTLTASGGSTYLWSTGATTASITVTASGSYSVTGTSAAGCSATSSAIGVTVLPLPTVSVAASGPTTFCQGGSVTLTASGADSYSWSNGATTASIAVSAAGSYSVVGTSTAGCTATSAATAVVVNPTPDQPTVTASADGKTLTSSAADGNQWYLNGTAIAGATGPSYQPTTAGSYTVVVTSAAGCASLPSAPQGVVLAAANPALAAQVRLFPNPTRGEVTLAVPNVAGGREVQVRLLNLLGQVVQTRTAAPGTTLTLNLTGLATGVYAVQVQIGSDTVTKRLVLE